MKTYDFKSTGKLVFDPHRYKMHASKTKWWCVLEVDESIGAYYRWWMDRHWWEVDTHSLKRKFSRPATSPHISIIRGEKPRRNIDDWKKNNKSILEFEYSCKIRQVGDTTGGNRPDHFWFLDVYFPEYLEIREHFGLPIRHYNTKNSFDAHMTIARVFS